MKPNSTRLWIMKLQEIDPDGKRLLDAGITNNLNKKKKVKLVRPAAHCGLGGSLAGGPSRTFPRLRGLYRVILLTLCSLAWCMRPGQLRDHPRPRALEVPAVC